jgi:hypothetical protein
VSVAVAILVDATIVRGVLLPATMMLLGDKTWYLPNKLARPEAAPRAGGRAGSRVGPQPARHVQRPTPAEPTRRASPRL